MLSAILGNGPNAANGYTNTNRPTFSGTAPPFSTVELFAKPSSLDVSEPLGYAIASEAGQWTLATGPLADGISTVTAVVTPPGGYPGPMQPLANNGRVVIDTVAPKVVGISDSGAGQVTVYFRDDLSGNELHQPVQCVTLCLCRSAPVGFLPHFCYSRRRQPANRRGGRDLDNPW
jgi:hypothetical protein